MCVGNYDAHPSRSFAFLPSNLSLKKNQNQNPICIQTHTNSDCPGVHTHLQLSLGWVVTERAQYVAQLRAGNVTLDWREQATYRPSMSVEWGLLNIALTSRIQPIVEGKECS